MSHAQAISLLVEQLEKERWGYKNQHSIIDTATASIRRAEENAKRISKSMTSLESAIVALGGVVPPEHKEPKSPSEYSGLSDYLREIDPLTIKDRLGREVVNIGRLYEPRVPPILR